MSNEYAGKILIFPALFHILVIVTTVNGIQWQDGDHGPWSLGCDFRGQDIGNVQVPGERCGQACQDNTACTHFTWSRFQGGTCWLKGGQASRDSAVASNEDGIVCGLNAGRTQTSGGGSQAASGAISWQQGDHGPWSFHCDFQGQDIGNVNVPGDRCGQACWDNAACTHFVWTDFQGGTCWLKGGQTSQSSATPSSQAGIVCGLNNRTPGTPVDPGTGGNTANCIGGSLPGKSTRFWDCAKPSCGWPGKITNSDTVVQSCAIDGRTPVDKNAQSGFNGGPAYVCSQQQPIIINTNLAYGFAAKHIPAGQSENDICCKCFKLDFTGALAGKTMIVQAINIGQVGELGEGQFDIQIPGGGVGIIDACSKQYPNWASIGGQTFGGVGSKGDCEALPEALRPGCRFRWDWMNGVSNPAHNYCEVPCPKALTDITKCAR